MAEGVRVVPFEQFDFAAYHERAYKGKTWNQVLEENEFFDGEVEIANSAHEIWRKVNGHK